MSIRAYPFGLLRHALEGPATARLRPVEWCALTLHELGHIYYGHTWQRLAWLLSLAWLRDRAGWLEAVRAQELQADAFVARFGFGPVWSLVLQANPEPQSWSHPSTAERVAALRSIPRPAGVTSPLDSPALRAKEQR